MIHPTRPIGAMANRNQAIRRFHHAWFRNLSMVVAGMLAWTGVTARSASTPSVPAPVLLVVMDPLASELACACVKGYGQRNYRVLAARLRSALQQPVAIEFTDDLAETLSLVGAGHHLVIVGDRADLPHQLERAKVQSHPVAELTGLDGATTSPALIVVQSNDIVRTNRDLAGRTLLFGMRESNARYAAVLDRLRKTGVEASVKRLERTSAQEAALDVLDSGEPLPPAAILPAYALPLLEGCGTVKPGTLRVVDRSEPVPFVGVYVDDAMPEILEKKVIRCLEGIRDQPKDLKSLETRDGFRRLESRAADRSKPSVGMPADWPDWRGARRDGRVGRLPARLPDSPRIVWKKGAMPGCLSGLSVAGGRLILAERDFRDENDVYRCLDGTTGELRWRVDFPARGRLDYGQSPRATPVISRDRAYLLGAFGELRCVGLDDGRVHWRRHLSKDFGVPIPTWGASATPLLVDDLLIVHPGAPTAAIAALDAATGVVRWATPGRPAAYASPILVEAGGTRQIVGYDKSSLGGWDVMTGKRLWELVPPVDRDFNVPTPIAVEGGIIVASENNGTRHYRFDAKGRLESKPVAICADLTPDTATPVVSAGRLFGAHPGLRCLDIRQGLRTVWHQVEGLDGDFASLIADDERVLVVTLGGELLLLDARADGFSVLSRSRVFEDEVETYSHPALVGSRLYLRGGTSVVCLDLDGT
jgi:outer membrane protein assembly factor BamB